MSLKDKYIRDEYDVVHFDRKTYKEDYLKGIYFGSNKSKKSLIGLESFIRIKTNYEDIDPQIPYIEMLQHNFDSHIKAKHRDIHQWMIIAAVSEPDFVYEDSYKNDVFYFDRIIGKKYTRVVIGKDKKGNLYVITAYNHDFTKSLDSGKNLLYKNLSEVC